MTKEQAQQLFEAQQKGHKVCVSARGYVSNPFSTTIYKVDDEIMMDSDFYAEQPLHKISIDDVYVVLKQVGARQYLGL